MSSDDGDHDEEYMLSDNDHDDTSMEDEEEHYTDNCSPRMEDDVELYTDNGSPSMEDMVDHHSDFDDDYDMVDNYIDIHEDFASKGAIFDYSSSTTQEEEAPLRFTKFEYGPAYFEDLRRPTPREAPSSPRRPRHKSIIEMMYKADAPTRRPNKIVRAREHHRAHHMAQDVRPQHDPPRHYSPSSPSHRKMSAHAHDHHHREHHLATQARPPRHHHRHASPRLSKAPQAPCKCTWSIVKARQGPSSTHILSTSPSTT